MVRILSLFLANTLSLLLMCAAGSSQISPVRVCTRFAGVEPSPEENSAEYSLKRFTRALDQQKLSSGRSIIGVSILSTSKDQAFEEAQKQNCEYLADLTWFDQRTGELAPPSPGGTAGPGLSSVYSIYSTRITYQLFKVGQQKPIAQGVALPTRENKRIDYYTPAAKMIAQRVGP